jgi:DNA polymerase elongation subunit (family B)
MTDDATLTFIPINDKLKALGVVRFARKSNVIDIGFKDGQTVVFDIDPKKVTNTRDNFEKEAKRYPGLSKSTISKVSLALLDSTNNYLQYLLYSKAAADAPDGKGDRQHPSIATLSRNPAAVVSMRLAKRYCQNLFVDNLGQPHAAVKIDRHLEVLPIKSSRFKNWLCKVFYDFSSDRKKQVPNTDSQSKKIHSVEDVENETEKKAEEGTGEDDEDTADILTTETLNNVLRVLEAKATFSGNPPKELHLRVAKYDDSILYDLTNPEWQVVRVAVTGLDIEYAPVAFTRYSNQISQVYPSKEYQPEIFDRFIGLLNIRDSEDNKLLFKIYIVALFYPEIQHPALMLYGEKATAKSTLQELIKMLVDPSVIRTMAFTRNIEGMIQKLAHNYLCYFDNVSKISEPISDILCRAVTGSGFSKRELFTNDDDVIYNFKRCIGINGINLGATKSDLIDRGLIIEHTPIPRDKKRLVKEIWQKFNEIRPQLLGYIFDILIRVLKFQKQNPEGLRLREYPRLADFTEVGEIISRCMDNEAGKFVDAYFRNIDLQTRDIVENDVVGKAIEILIDSRTPPLWNGTITELLDLLTKIAQDNLRIKTSNGKLWPQAPNSLSRRINLIRADLRSIGIIVEKDSLNKSDRQWTIRRFITNNNYNYNNYNNNAIIASKNNILYQQAIVRKQNYLKVEQISPEQPYRLKPDNRAQITKGNLGDISGDRSFELNHISPCISPEDNADNRAQNEQLRRSGDTGDICSLSSQNYQTKLPKELQDWCNNGTIIPKSVQLPTVTKILDKYLTFDFEWDINTHVLEAASFVDSTGNSKVLLRSDFDNSSERELLKYINSKIIEYDWSIGWNSTGHARNSESAKNSDLAILYERCVANDIQSIVSLGPNGVPYIGYPKHIDLCNVHSKVMVQDTIYKKAYRTHKLDEVSKVLLGHGKYKDFSGKDFKSLPIEEQIKYSLRDSELVMALSKHNDFEVLDAMLAISEITGLDFELVCKTNLSKWWSAIFDRMVKDRECQPRTATSFSGTYYEGAEVLVPKQGLYHNVVVIDAISLYPSVAINYNISYDTLNCTCCKDDPGARITLDSEFLKDCKFIKQDNNCWICKRKEGAFPKKLKIFKAERLKQKKLGNNSKQLALKILINGAYGCFGFAGFAYYEPRVAELITAYGRQTLSKMQDTARDLGFEIIYGDTDSLFLHNAPKESLSKFKDSFNRELDIELEIKSTYFNFILSSGKKHYLGYGVNNDKGKEVFDIVGFEGNKNDRPEFVNNVFKQLVNDVVKNSVEPILNLRHAMSDLEEQPSKVNPDLLKISKVLGENPEDYKSQSCQASKIGKALGARKGDLIQYFHSDIKKTGKSWSTNPADIDIAKYKQTLWNTVKEILEIAGYPVEDLSKEFGVKNPKKSKSKNGHGNA